MQVHKGLEHLPSFDNAVVTIGSFDGVHHGHRAIISRVIQKAKEVKGESIIVTFDPHPRQVVFPNDKSLKLLNSLSEKIELLSKTDLDHLVIVPFSVEFSQINPYKYVDDILIDKIKVQHLIIGYDHRFGLNRVGNIDLLNLYADKGSFTVEEICRQDVDDLRVSSTKIRNHLLEGEVMKANKLLDAPYILTGIVTKGSQIAGSLGYPTANCTISNNSKLIPASGTYAATATCNNQHYEGMLYIGSSPTLQSLDSVIIEMNLFGEVKESLYDMEINISPLKKFRGDEKFSSKEELLYNIHQDKIEVEHFFRAKKSQTLVSTVILNYNGINHLKNFLSSHQGSSSYEIAVIDNASTDNSLQWVSEHHPDVRIISLEKNEGFANGYNLGLNKVGSKYIALVNSDVRVTEDWLKTIIAKMEEDETIAAVQPKILSQSNPSQFEYAGGAGGMIDMVGYPLCRGRILDTVEEDIGQYDKDEELFWASGAAMVMRSDLFSKAGGFDKDFFAHMEEIDLCWRLKKIGYRIAYEPKSTVYHVGGGTLDYDSPQKVHLNLRNNYWMILKNKSISSLIWIIPIRIFLDTSYSFLFLLKGRFKHFASAITGVSKGLFSTPSQSRKSINFFNKRYQFHSTSTSGIVKIILPLSYFIFSKKKFSDIVK